MGFPKKGTRKIVVAGNTYLWRVGVDEDWMNPTPPNPTDIHSLAVESPDHPGRYVAVAFALPEEHTGLGFPITPGLVAEIIQSAIAQGWPAVERPWHRIWRDGALIDTRRAAAQPDVAADDVLTRSARSERHR
jgi:hypothetical protein